MGHPAPRHPGGRHPSGPLRRTGRHAGSRRAARPPCWTWYAG